MYAVSLGEPTAQEWSENPAASCCAGKPRRGAGSEQRKLVRVKCAKSLDFQN